MLKPNQFGLYDMHGNIWEWCFDSYSEDYYSESPCENPVNQNNEPNKVTRGGGYHGFSEMCRGAFRHNEPPNYYAYDIGCRLAKTVS